jgi:hypothetical protein
MDVDGSPFRAPVLLKYAPSLNKITAHILSRRRIVAETQSRPSVDCYPLEPELVGILIPIFQARV